MNARPRIRTANAADAAELARLAVELGYPTTPAQAAARLAKIAEADIGAAVLVAESPGGASLLGWVHVEPRVHLESEPFVEIGGLVVGARAHRTGVGRALMEAAESRARAAGFAVVRLRSNVVRESAHRFYDSIGYARAKQQIAFVKELDPGD